MIIDQGIVVNLDINVASLLLMLGVLVMCLRTLSFKDMRSMIFVNLIVLIVFCNVCSLAQFFFYSIHGSRTLLMILELLIEVSLVMVVYFWLLFVMHEIFKSRDYIKRRIVVYSVPVGLLVIANIISCFTGFLWYYDDDLIFHYTGFYYINVIIEYSYLVYAIIQYIRFKKQEKSTARFNIWLYFIPMALGSITEAATGYAAFTLGSALGFTALYVIMVREMGYRDHESGFYNPVFLSHLYSLIENKEYDLSSVVTYEISEAERLGSFSEALRTVLPEGSDTIRTDENKLITVSESSDRGYLFMLTEDVEMIAEEAGVDVNVNTLVRKKNEDPADFFIDNIRLRRS